MLKSWLRNLLPSDLRRILKRRVRKLKNLIYPSPKTTLESLNRLLTEELGISAGDKLLVASGFSGLNADGYSPIDVIRLLQGIVGNEGLIMMPYYPPMNSTEWASKGNVFDVNKVKSGMGVLTNVFANVPDVVMSVHPTKAVCVWGKNAADYVEGHDCSVTPFYWDSPYGKLLKAGSKSLGLGVKNIPIFHAIEDVLSPMGEYYDKKKCDLEVVTKSGERRLVSTFVHDQRVMDRCEPAGNYVRGLGCKSYKRKSFGNAFCYVVDNQDLLAACEVEFKNGHTRLRDAKLL